MVSYFFRYGELWDLSFCRAMMWFIVIWQLIFLSFNPVLLVACFLVVFYYMTCFVQCLLYLATTRFVSWKIQRLFGVPTLEKTAHDDFRKLASAVYLQVSTISQALIFVTRSRSWSYVERPGFFLVVAFVLAQLVRQWNICLDCFDYFWRKQSSLDLSINRLLLWLLSMLTGVLLPLKELVGVGPE